MPIHSRQPHRNRCLGTGPVFRLPLSLVLGSMLLLGLGCRERFQSIAEIRQRYELPPLPTAEDYPNSDAVVLLSTIDTELYPTEYGLHTDQVVHRIVRVFRNATAHSVVEIDLFPGEELVDLEARVHEPDGRVIPVAREEIDLGRIGVPVPSRVSRSGRSDRSDSGPEGDSEDSDTRIEKNTVLLRFPGLVPGSSYEYRYRLRRKEPYMYDSWAVQEYDPVLYTHYTLTVPKHLYDAEGRAWDWRYRYYRCARIGEPEFYETPGHGLGLSETYKWTLRNVPGFTPEPRMPAPEEHLAFARFAHTSWRTWNEVTASFWRNHLKDAFDPDRRVTDALPGILSGGTPTGTSTAQREIRVLAGFVQDLPTIELDLGQGSLTPSRPGKVLERGRADGKDKAILLVALLREAGYEADPALVVTRDHGPLDVDFPNWSFNHMLVLVTLEGRRIWIDPTARHYPLGELPWRCEKVEAVVVRGEGGAEVLTTPQPEARHNRRLSETRVAIQADGSARGAVEIVIDGEPGSLLLGSLDAFGGRREQVRRFCETEIRQTYADAEVETPQLRETSPGCALVSFTFTTRKFLDTEDILPHLGPAPFPFDDGLDLIGQVERRFPVDNGYPASWTRRIFVDLSDSPFRIVAVPSPIDIRDREISYGSRYELRGDAGLQGEETLEIRLPRLLTRTYKTAREILDAREMAGATSVVLRRER